MCNKLMEYNCPICGNKLIRLTVNGGIILLAKIKIAQGMSKHYVKTT